MFFGKGDTSRLGDDERVTLEHLRRMNETGHINALEPDKGETAIRAVDFFDRWENVFGAIASGRNIVILFAGGLGFWWATGGENFVTTFIKGVVDK